MHNRPTTSLHSVLGLWSSLLTCVDNPDLPYLCAAAAHLAQNLAGETVDQLLHDMMSRCSVSQHTSVDVGNLSVLSICSALNV